MRTVPIVALDEGREGGRPLGLAVPGPGVPPLLGDRPVNPLDLAVLPGAEGPGVDMADALRLEERVELPAAVAGAVVRHHPLDGDAQPGEEAQAAAHECRAGALPLVGERLGVGDPAAVVDRDVEARAPGPSRRAAAAPRRPVPAAVGDAGHLLDVDVDRLARPLPPVAHGGDRPAGANLAGHAVDVGETGQAPPRDDPDAGPGGDARRGGQPERGEQQPVSGRDDPLCLYSIEAEHNSHGKLSTARIEN